MNSINVEFKEKYSVSNKIKRGDIFLFKDKENNIDVFQLIQVNSGEFKIIILNDANRVIDEIWDGEFLSNYTPEQFGKYIEGIICEGKFYRWISREFIKIEIYEYKDY